MTFKNYCWLCGKEVKHPLKVFCSKAHAKEFNLIKLEELKAVNTYKRVLDIAKYNLVIEETLGMDCIKELPEIMKERIRVALHYIRNV